MEVLSITEPFSNSRKLYLDLLKRCLTRMLFPDAPISSIAVPRVDGDMYQSTIEVLSSLYHRVSPGGYVIIDDYGAIRSCRAAVHDFRESTSVTEQIERIDWTGVFWRKEAMAGSV
jgi:O-methyltransferase